MINEELAQSIYKNYSDEELVQEFYAYENFNNIENIESTLIIESFDVVYPLLIHESAYRYSKNHMHKNNNLVDFKLC